MSASDGDLDHLPSGAEKEMARESAEIADVSNQAVQTAEGRNNVDDIEGAADNLQQESTNSAEDRNRASI